MPPLNNFPKINPPIIKPIAPPVFRLKDYLTSYYLAIIPCIGGAR